MNFKDANKTLKTLCTVTLVDRSMNPIHDFTLESDKPNSACKAMFIYEGVGYVSAKCVHSASGDTFIEAHEIEIPVYHLPFHNELN